MTIPSEDMAEVYSHLIMKNYQNSDDKILNKKIKFIKDRLKKLIYFYILDMIKKIKASLHEKLILIFLILLGVFALSFTIVIKNKCLFVKNFDPQKIKYSKPNNIVVLNAECGNVIIELYPEISPNGVERFKKLINSKSYDNVAFHRVIKDKLVQAGDFSLVKKIK